MRVWCKCGYNYIPVYESLGSQPMCPVCGRESNKFEMLKGRWTRERGNTPWTWKDWEVWKNPDWTGPKPARPKEPRNILISSWLTRLLRKMGMLK